MSNLIDHYPQYNYVVVNDGSADSTSQICHQEGYNIIDLPVNLGLAGAFQTGLKYADQEGYDCAIQFDADGQHRPEYIEDLLKEIENGYDIVIGSRFVTEKKPFSMRMLGNRMIERAIKFSTGKVLTPILLPECVCTVRRSFTNLHPISTTDQSRIPFHS